MGEARLELPPAEPFPSVITPSGLTPGTRSEAEAAFRRNSLVQTDSAAPLIDGTKSTNPAQSATNYEKALSAWQKKDSVSSTLSTTSHDDALHPTTSNDSPSRPTPASPTTAYPFPAPGQGVVPLHPGVGSGQAEAVKKARPSGLSLGDLGRKQSWSTQDFKRLGSARLMGAVGEGEMGYGSVGGEGGK